MTEWEEWTECMNNAVQDGDMQALIEICEDLIAALKREAGQ